MTTSEENPIHRNYAPPAELLQPAFVETYKSQIGILLEGLKLLALGNGGAIVVLLSSYGTLIANCRQLPNLTPPTQCFALGLLACVVAFIGSYLTQTYFLKYLTSRDIGRIRGHVLLFSITSVAIAASALLLLAGASAATTEFAKFKCERPLPSK